MGEDQVDTVSDQPTRGERNNNPGNIDRNAIKWQGMAEDQSGDVRFVVFETPVDGIRALAKVILSYRLKYGLNTVRSIIDRWAPPGENDTGAYVKDVSQQLSVSPDSLIKPETAETLEMLVRAIIKHENGRCIYKDADIAKAISMALA